MPPPKKGVVIARPIGLYTDISEQTVVAKDGTFTLYVEFPGPYRLWILEAGKRIAEREVDIEHYDVPKSLPLLEIHTDAQDADKAGIPILTVCEILADPLKYDGRLVKVRGRWYGTDEGSWIFEVTCRGVFSTDGYTWPSSVAMADPGIRASHRLHPVDFQFDLKSMRKAHAKYRRLRKLVAEECLFVTQTGLFETRTDWSQAKTVYPNGTWIFAGFGHLGEAPGQLLLKSMDDVIAVPGCVGKFKTKN